MLPKRNVPRGNWPDIITDEAVHRKTSYVKNIVLNGILQHKEKVVPVRLFPEPYYSDKFHNLAEFMRHLSIHGTSYSLRKVSSDGQRKQMMQSLEETELSGSIHLEEHILEMLVGLVKAKSMTGM